MNSENQTKKRISRFTLKPAHIKILICISQRLIATHMAKQLKKSKSTISEHLKNLERYNYIKTQVKSSIKVYELTNRGRTVCSEFIRGSDGWLQDRGHNIKLKFEIVHLPTHGFGEDWKPKKLKNVTFYSKYYGDFFVEVTTKSVIVQLPILWRKDSDQVMIEAGITGDKMKNHLEIEYSGLKLGTPKVLSHVIMQHHAIPNEPYAKILTENKLSYKDEKIAIDASEGYPELEFIDNKTAQNDFMRYTEFIKDCISNPTTRLPSEMDESIKQNSQSIEHIKQRNRILDVTINTNLVPAINYLAENLSIHVAVEKRICAGIEKLNTGIEKWNQILEALQRKLS